MNSVKSQLIYGSLILQRNPITLRGLNDFETAYYQYAEAVRADKSKGLFDVKASGDDNPNNNSNVFGLSKNDAIFKGNVSSSESVSSLSRLPDRKLYLVVNLQSVWKFPEWPLESAGDDGSNEGVQTIVKAKSQLYFHNAEGLYFIGKAPVSYHLDRFNGRVDPPFSALHFFFKAQLISGHISVPDEYRWLAMEEIRALVSNGYWGAIKEVLSY